MAVRLGGRTGPSVTGGGGEIGAGSRGRSVGWGLPSVGRCSAMASRMRRNAACRASPDAGAILLSGPRCGLVRCGGSGEEGG